MAVEEYGCYCNGGPVAAGKEHSAVGEYGGGAGDGVGFGRDGPGLTWAAELDLGYGTVVGGDGNVEESHYRVRESLGLGSERAFPLIDGCGHGDADSGSVHDSYYYDDYYYYFP